jgi:hypothetical protein
MPVSIVINDLSGSSPFNVYLCDNTNTTCVYIDRISSTPYEFEVPTLFVKLPDVNLRIVDSSGCEITSNLTL